MVDLSCSHYTHKNSSCVRRQYINSLNCSNHITICIYSKSSCGTPWKHTYLILKLKKKKDCSGSSRMTWSEGSEGLKAGVGGGVGDQWQYYLSYEAEMKKPWLRQHQWEWRKGVVRKTEELHQAGLHDRLDVRDLNMEFISIQVMFEALEGKSCLKGHSDEKKWSQAESSDIQILDSCDLIVFLTKKRWRKIWRWRKETRWISPFKGAGGRQEFAEQRMESKNGVMSVTEVQGETQWSKHAEQCCWGRGGWKDVDMKRTDEVASLEWRQTKLDNPKRDWDDFGEVDLVSVDEASFRMLGLQPA